MNTDSRTIKSDAVVSTLPLISVIIPCYNHGKFLKKAVESILNQPFEKVEIIIVNDGSIDNSSEVAQSLIERYNNCAITLIDQPNSGEPAISRNNGIKLARGTYILPLDADDYLDSHSFEYYQEAIQTNKDELIVVYGWMQRFGDIDTIWRTIQVDPSVLLRQSKFGNCSLYSRELWEMHNGYRVGIPGYEDWEFWISCAELGAKFINIPKVTYHYYVSENDSMGKSGRRKHEWLIAKIFLEHPDLYEDEELVWADNYLRRNPEPPVEREIHGPHDHYPMAASLLIAAYPAQYSEAEQRWAAEYLEQNQPKLLKGLKDRALLKAHGETSPNEDKKRLTFQIFKNALAQFENMQFNEAISLIEDYRKKVEYSDFTKDDRRTAKQPTVSIVIVAYNTKHELIKCLRSVVDQKDSDFEIVLVDNGGNDEVSDQLTEFNLLHVHCPINLVLSEGRNVGAHFSQGKLLAFLDDDALVDNSYIKSIKKAFDQYDIDALRGRIIPKTPDDPKCFSEHYDYGLIPIPCTVNTEGNSAFKRDIYLEMNGMDPLLFGAEGLELSFRIARKYGDNRIIYWPETVIYHDYANSATKFTTKQSRHERVRYYLESKFPGVYNWHYSYRRYMSSDDSRHFANSLIKFNIQDNSINADVLKMALINRGWSSKLDLYKKTFKSFENFRELSSPKISVVVISVSYNDDILFSMKKLRLQQRETTEIIYVINGGAEETFKPLLPYVDKLIVLTENTGAYVGRNIGSLFSNSPVVLFMDDDAIPDSRFIEAHVDAHRRYDSICVRGVVLPKTNNPLNDLAKHYYRGDNPFPTFSDVEGNSSYNSRIFFQSGGWDDEIRFGNGGAEFSRRLIEFEPDLRKQIYVPDAIIYHDYSSGEDHLQAKRKKQAAGKAHLRNKYPDIDRFLATWGPLFNKSEFLIDRDCPGETAQQAIHYQVPDAIEFPPNQVNSRTNSPDADDPIVQAMALAEKGMLRAAKARLERLVESPVHSFRARTAMNSLTNSTQ